MEVTGGGVEVTGLLLTRKVSTLPGSIPLKAEKKLEEMLEKPSFGS